MVRSLTYEPEALRALDFFLLGQQVSDWLEAHHLDSISVSGNSIKASVSKDFLKPRKGVDCDAGPGGSHRDPQRAQYEC